MTDPWIAEVDVDVRLARALIDEQFPDLADWPLTLLGSGWDNTVFALGPKWVFRFPRRQLAVGLLESERRCLPQMSRLLPLAVPVPLFIGAAGPRFPWPFLGLEFVAGITACRAALGPTERRAAAEPLAHFLAALHAIPADRAATWGAPADNVRRLDVPYRATQATEALAAATGLVEARVAQVLPAVIADAPPTWRPRERSLCHGDLYARHLLVDDGLRPCGVIDWGDLHRGDGTVDLALAHGFLPPDAHPVFRRAYGAIDEASWKVARLRATVTNLNALRYAADVGDAALVAEASWALANIVAAFSAADSGAADRRRSGPTAGGPSAPRS
ncbi:phosphotransferase [Engelhardtia mirabilis]|uniref:Phosphotransferase enzyme family protein n=1 Tax=Engelhardtia mirabilis TaxID=2528011 RepID=A0A518BGB6_9BACT|nr:Phosphotransferase enzyme family protein [Planctomycetes bacterium Pla133]QDV00351.1 Phosphotransferase enzyme family protein [Planctomycetes bacterium Pla86]